MWAGTPMITVKGCYGNQLIIIRWFGDIKMNRLHSLHWRLTTD